MRERLTRVITPLPSVEQEALERMGFAFEETPDRVVVTYPDGAIRETINEREGRYVVFFIYHHETRQITEIYNRFTRMSIMMLRPARFP